MTRQDLEEAILNLEYLVLNHFDPAKVEDYYQQLQAFRRELAALEEKHVFLTPAPYRFLYRQH